MWCNRLKFIEGTDAFILEAVFSNLVYNLLNLPFSKPNEIKVMKYIRDECQKKLDVINSGHSNEQDLEIKNQNLEFDTESNLSVAFAKLRVQV